VNRQRHPGLAVTALGIIIAVTASWWALALLPIGSPAPEWVLRTRLACFGAGPEGLPNAGGWVLLIGEPIGMLGVLLAVWGDALRQDLRWLASTRVGRLGMAATILGLVWGAVWSGSRVQAALVAGPVSAGPGATALRSPTPALRLTDQHRSPFDLAGLRGRAVIVTFAYAHCEAVCPMIVHEIRSARRAAGRDDIPLVVVTLDPWRDVVPRLSTIADQWELAGDDRVLSGGIEEVNRALDAWGVQRTRDEATGQLDHVPLTFIVDRDGRLAWRLGGDAGSLAELLRLS